MKFLPSRSESSVVGQASRLSVLGREMTGCKPVPRKIPECYAVRSYPGSRSRCPVTDSRQAGPERPKSGDKPLPERHPTRYTVRCIQLKDGLQLQWTARIGSQELHENLSLKESLSRLESIFPKTFREANLLTTGADSQYRSRDGVSVKASQKTAQRTPAPVSHNREKQYLIPEGQPCLFLEAIGVMTADGRVRASMTHKFHQINRFLELVNDIIPHLPNEGQLRVVDFGSGKSYLTFALHHLLVRVHQREVQILAIDQNADVIETCRGLCERLQLQGIEFAAQPISAVEQTEAVHLAVALHACDGATDQALAQAVHWQSDVILAVPCCQHEVALSIRSEPLDLLLRHGILKERFAALATDAPASGCSRSSGLPDADPRVRGLGPHTEEPPHPRHQTPRGRDHCRDQDCLCRSQNPARV